MVSDGERELAGSAAIESGLAHSSRQPQLRARRDAAPDVCVLRRKGGLFLDEDNPAKRKKTSHGRKCAAKVSREKIRMEG